MKRAEFYHIIVKHWMTVLRTNAEWSVIKKLNLEEIKVKIEQILGESTEEIIKIGKTILNNPELGYREKNTSEYVRRIFDELDIPYSYPHAVMGVKAKRKKRWL